MSGTPTLAAQPIRERLKFIDMARSIAILMMLEGHFTGSALNDAYRDKGVLLYKSWHMLHGLTSPLFFMVTGVVFVYLLSKDNSVPYLKNERVKKGFGRVRMLLFWGYFIQFNIIVFGRSLYYGFKNVWNGDGWIFKFHFDWFYAFHVLQSIGFGILFILLIYGVYKLIQRGALHWYFLIAGILIFAFYGNMKHHIWWDDHLIAEGKLLPENRHYIPKNFPKFIQNMFYGQFSEFSFVRYSGYTVLGGMVGALIRKYESKVKEWWFGTTFLSAGILLSFLPLMTFKYIDIATSAIGLADYSHFVFNATSFSRIGQVLILLGVLMLIDANFKVRAQLFLKIGQNTFPIYIVHVIILYGGILGLGLEPSEWYKRQFDPYQSALISATAITFFFVMVRYIDPLTELYYKVFGVFYPKRKKQNRTN